MTPGTILVVSDRADDVDLMLRALRRNHIGNEVEVLADAASALAWIFGTGPHSGRGVRLPVLVLLDLQLPRTQGLQVLEALRADERTQRVAVVVLTSSTEDQDVARAYELGANSYVRKPVAVDEVAEVVRQLGLYWVLLTEPAHR